MAFTPAAVQIPGIDWASMFRVVMLAFPIVLLFGLEAASLWVLGLLLIKPLTVQWTQHIGPPLMNQALIDERGRGMVIPFGVAAGALAAWMALKPVITDNPQLRAGIVMLAVFVVLVWLRPSMAVVPVLCISAAGGSGMLLVAAPLVIMLARRDQRCRLNIRRSLRRTAMTLLYAFLGFLMVLPFANTSAGSPRANDRLESPTSPTGDGSWYDQFSNWLFQRGPGVDPATPSRPVQVPGQPQTGTTPPADSTPWLLWLGLAIAAVVLIAAVVWFRRRRRHGGPGEYDSNAAVTLARLEAIGAAIGRRRAPNEGALTFASALASRTGDTRLGEAGPLVSGDVYGSAAVEPQLVATQLAAVEASPPPPPPVPPLAKRVADRVRSAPISRRGVVVSATTLAALGAFVWFGAPLLGDLRDPVDRTLAYVEQADAPDEWHTLMGTSASDLTGWETCSSLGDEEGQLGWVSAGLSHRSEPLGAEVEALGHKSGVGGGWLQVGTGALTATINIDATGPSLALFDQPWRVSEWPSVSLQPFSTIEDVLTATAVRDPIRTDYVDRNGDHFARFESLPPDREAVYGDAAIAVPIELDRVDLMRVVDIWTDDAGVPVRVRIIGDGPDGQWMEWRRLAEVSDARLVLPSCEPASPWANDDWIGAEAWTPSRAAPLLIDFDDNGNPFDQNSWESGEIIAEPSGTIAGPVDVLTIGDLNSISADAEEDDKQEYTFDLHWGGGADITLISADGWPAATRIDAPGESVAAWDEFEQFFIYESFVSLVTASTFPEFQSEALDLILEPLWDGETQVAVGVHGERQDVLTLLTQSDASGITVGRNVDGDIVSIIVWGDWQQWRLFEFEGTPPPSVVNRETELRQCLAGKRTVELSGRCSWDDE